MYKMTKVNSSAISEIGYDRAKGTLKIVFNSGSEYEYIGVSEAEYKDFVSAPSVGRYYNMKIRSNYTAK